MNRATLIVLPPVSILVCCCISIAFSLPLRSQPVPASTNGPDTDWRVYAASNYSTKYSPLRQIDSSNFKKLSIAWRWTSVDQPLLQADSSLKTWRNESTPLKIGNVLYTSTSLSQVAAIDAGTGKTLWQYNPGTYQSNVPPNMGFLNRGLAYWEEANEKRIYIATGDAYLIALNAITGKPVLTFGTGGRIDLTSGLRRAVNSDYYGVNSPPLISNGVIVVGSNVLDYPAEEAMPPGDVRGFDVRTGQLLWTFESVPQGAAYGANTWERESWKNAGNTNVWTWMSCDDSLGYVYLPFGTPSNDFYGGQRPGGNLFGESIVALNVKTGQRVWHYQTVHHGLWDYDLPAAPNLVDVVIDHTKRKILAQVTKQGFLFVLDRVTGLPIWPILEKPVPPSGTPGEQAAATQPFPTWPLPFDRQGIDTADLIDFTPELRKLALATLSNYEYGPLYTPPSEKGTVLLPGTVGGGSWAGAAVDPVRNILYVASVTKPAVARLFPLQTASNSSTYAGYWTLEEFVGPQGLPLVKPPYGRITAIDLHTGQHLWMQPVGNSLNDHPFLKNQLHSPIGSPERNHLLLTPTLLLAAQEASSFYTPYRQSSLMVTTSKQESYLRAFHRTTGQLMGEIPLPAGASGAPILYALNGKSFVVVPIGGGSEKAELIAYTLPE